MASNSRSKLRFIRTGLLLGSTLLALLAAELVVRVTVPQLAWVQRNESVLGWSTSEYEQFDPQASRKRHNEKRILFLGDSMLAGGGVSSLDKRFPELLDHRIGDDVAVRIIAAGAWGTDQELLAFLQKGAAWQPDLVVLAFVSTNDLANILSHKYRDLKLKPYFSLDVGGALELHDGYGRSMSYDAVRESGTLVVGRRVRSYLWDYLRFRMGQGSDTEEPKGAQKYELVDTRYRITDLRPARENEVVRRAPKLTWSPQDGVNRVSAYISEDFEINTYQWALLESILRRLNEEVERIGAELIVMLLPDLFDTRDAATITGGTFTMEYRTPSEPFTFRSAEPRDRLAGITERIGAVFFDPTPEFIARVEDEKTMRIVWPENGDRHFSDVGHEILAQLAYDFLVERITER